ncbi:formate dehydrogenase subunit alpha [Sphingomonas haloaromaticamans]|jgi:formate dehydrogenase major subunit|uniref:Formate dehydrogenase subunit alpha n=1 Tax=Edaphosphingomonas haloaromaticamans TaxID=653954 RepID=A0A1S1HB99_9SPHN|nr:formate dehydrogenase subunit alpha [Sphingomonas haloaromaticamans]
MQPNMARRLEFSARNCALLWRPTVVPGVVYTTFHHPETQANLVTTEFSDWATNCPEYKVTAVQVSASNGPSDWQENYAALTTRARRIEAI